MIVTNEKCRSVIRGGDHFDHSCVCHPYFFFAFSFSLGSLTYKNSLNTKLMSGFKRYKGKYNKKCEKN